MENRLLDINAPANRLPDIDLPVDFFAWVDITQEVLGWYNIPCKIKAGIFVLCVEGELTATINLKECRIKKDDFIVVAPGSVIQFHGSETNFRLSFVGFSSKFVGEVNLIKSTMDFFPVMIENPVLPLRTEAAEIYRDYFALLYKMFVGDMLTHPEIQRCVLESLLYGIASQYKQVEGTNRRLSRGEEICKELLRLVMKHYATERRVSFYADRMRLSAQHLCTTVKQQTGKTVADLIADVVIMDAKALLKSTNMPIKEISISLSFPNVSFFGKYFKRYVGMSPQQYRNS
ncbi:MAG: helix-turn-helix domain-containing protein [Rikenellaceae bacterium]|nr:helix-turn-helix domain-containing protein [Rikenellaceae bacterium]